MIIYKITNLINGKIYVGKQVTHNESYLGSGKILWRSIKKHGKENFKKEIIQECFSLKELNEQETYWILKLESYKREIGYNITFGGNGGDTYTNHPNKLEYSKNKSIASKKCGKMMNIEII